MNKCRGFETGGGGKMTYYQDSRPRRPRTLEDDQRETNQHRAWAKHRILREASNLDDTLCCLIGESDEERKAHASLRFFVLHSLAAIDKEGFLCEGVS
jgi:hypothetical protein